MKYENFETVEKLVRQIRGYEQKYAEVDGVKEVILSDDRYHVFRVRPEEESEYGECVLEFKNKVLNHIHGRIYELKDELTKL